MALDVVVLQSIDSFAIVVELFLERISFRLRKVALVRCAVEMLFPMNESIVCSDDSGLIPSELSGSNALVDAGVLVLKPCVDRLFILTKRRGRQGSNGD